MELTDKAKQLGNEPISITTLRQIGDNEFRVATPKDLERNEYLCSRQGLTKRELFAAMAMQGYIARDNGTENCYSYVDYARWSVASADALLNELTKN